ncbi:MAG: DUF2959 family protein [Planctomycetota bacterium]
MGATVSCLSTSQEVDTLKRVDNLVGRVELLHFEAELSKSRVDNAVDALVGLVEGEYQGDPVIAFEQLVTAIELSEDQAESLRDSVEPMHETADAVFTQWAQDAAELRIDTLRARSVSRLDDTRRRYEQILASVEQAQSAYDAFNLGLRDHATYLEHDFNPAAVASIQGEIQTLTKWAGEVDMRLDNTMQAAEEYVRASALPGTIEVAATTTTDE